MVKPATAEGSRTLYPAGATGFRANLQWQPGEFYFGNPQLRLRTLLKVYARAGENILLGSSAVGKSTTLGTGDALVYNPGLVTGPIGNETIPNTPSFSCNTQRTADPAIGQITNRLQELAGPRAVSGGGDLTGYIPCVYTAPQDGIYDVVFYGPNGNEGLDPKDRGTPTGEINLTSPSNFDATQGGTVAAWDVTVRSNDPNSTADLNGRLFTYYTSLFTGANSPTINGRPVNISFYPVTTDGFRYKTDLNGLDPNGFLLYGNRAGFLDPDGKTPLYHDVTSANAPNDDLLNNLQGGVIPVRPEFPIFFSNTVTNPEASNTIAAITPPAPGAASLPSLGSFIPPTPTAPILTNFGFTGNVGGNTSTVGAGGNFNYDANVDHTYQIVISRDGVNFDPTNPNNRVLRGLNLKGSNLQVSWDGKDNSGNPFPVGVNYPAQMQIQAGDYHFPLLDAENSLNGGPSIQVLNPPNGVCPPFNGGCNGGFYDDRGYRVSNGTTVGTVGSVLPNGNNPPSTPNSDPINGFDTRSTQRAFGDGSTIGFGDNKGLDLWTYYPTRPPQNALINIVGNQPDLSIKKSHTNNFIVGKQGVYKLSVANKDTAGYITDLSTDPVTVTDTLPAGLTFVSATGTGWSCSAAGQIVTCNYTGPTPIAPGAVLPDITVTVNVTSAAAGSVTNTATVSTPRDTPDSATGSDNTSPDQTNVLLAPVSYKSVKFLRDNNGNNTLNIGDDIQYTLIIENPGTNPVALTNIIVKDTIPVQLQVLQDAANPISVVTSNNGNNPNFTLASSFPTGNFNGSFDPVTFTNPGTLAPGGRVTITFNGRILPGAASPIANQGSINYDGDQGTPVLTDASDTNNPTAPGSNVNPGNPGTGTGNNVSQPNASDADPTIINFSTDVNPAGTKSVRLVTDADNSNSVTTGDTVEYTVTYVNNDPTFIVDSFLATDSIDISNLTFVPGSYSFQTFDGTATANNTTTVTANPGYNGTTDTNLTNPTTKGQLGAGGGKVVIKFRAIVKAPANTQIPNQAVATSSSTQQGVVTKSPSLTDAISAPGDVPQPLGGSEDKTVLPVVAPGPPNLRLVKRITNATRNGTPINGVNFSNFVSVNADDTAPGWSQLSPVGVPSIPATTPLQSGDEVEYTIYYLSDGAQPIKGAKFCDLIPAGTTFSPDSFESGKGILLNRAGSVVTQTNALDRDESTFFAPLSPLPAGNACSNQNNPDGTVIENMGTISNTAGSNYGFVRFRVKVK